VIRQKIKQTDFAAMAGIAHVPERNSAEECAR